MYILDNREPAMHKHKHIYTICIQKSMSSFCFGQLQCQKVYLLSLYNEMYFCGCCQKSFQGW